MKRGAILVNIARGSLVDETALYDLVKSGHTAAAGLDVLKSSPDGAKSALLELPRVLITPHVAGATDLTFRGTLNYIKHVIDAFAAGEYSNDVIRNPSPKDRKIEPTHGNTRITRIQSHICARAEVGQAHPERICIRENGLGCSPGLGVVNG